VAADASSKEGTMQEPSQESKGKSPYIVTEKVGNVDITFVLPKEHPEWYDPKAERLKLERYITSRFYQSHKIPTATYFPTVPFILRGVHQKYRTVPWERRNSEDRGQPRPMLIFKLPQNVGKIDIKTYLTKIYNFNIKKVNTLNYDAKLGRGKKGRAIEKRKPYKKAYVLLNNEPKSSSE
jgi:ribosomal protein L23